MKYIRFLFTLYIILSFSSSFSYSQTVETIGFIPNKGQYKSDIIGDSIIGKLCGLDHDIWLTDSGISIVYNSTNNEWDDYYYGFNIYYELQRIIISNIIPISLDRIQLYDSSSNVFNYYLPSCPNGLLDIRSYRKIIIESVLDGIDLEITFLSDNIITKFKYSNSIPYSLEKETTTIAISTEENLGIINYDTIEVGEVFSLFKHIPYPTYRNFIDNTKLDTSHSQIQWFTLFNGSFSKLANKRRYGFSWGQKFDIYPLQVSNSISDNLSNYYTVGSTCLAPKTPYLPFVPDDTGAYDRYLFPYSTEAFINKFDINGNLLWTTYYGSSQEDIAKTIEINSKDHIYISGRMSFRGRHDWDYYGSNLGPYLDSIAGGFSPSNKWENDFPLKPPPNNSYFSDSGFLFILKLDTNGKRIWSTLVGSGYGVFDYRGDKRYHTDDCDFFSSTKNSKDDIYFSGTTQSIINQRANRRNDNKWIGAICIDADKRMIDSKTYASIAGIPIVGNNKSSTWQIPLIDSLSGERWVNTINKTSWTSCTLDTIFLRTYPFILKLDSSDNLVWSTYFFTNQPINAMAVDKDDNLYIGGHTIENYLPLKRKEGGFFNDKDLIGNKNRVLDCSDGDAAKFISQRERRAYIAEFNSDNALIWCTYLEDSVDRPNTTALISDMAIDINNNLLVTGYTNNKAFPLLSKKGAYYGDHSLSSSLRSAFIMQFDSLSILKWSSLCVLEGSNWGTNLQSLPDGRLFLSIHGNATLITSNSVYFQRAYLFEFNKNYSLRNIHLLPFNVARLSMSMLATNLTLSNLHMENIAVDAYEEIERVLNHAPPSLNLSYSPRGSLFLSGNLMEFSGKFIKPTTTSFMQTEYSWFPYKIEDGTDSHSNSGFILKQSLCDSGNFIFPFTDSLVCAGTEINIPLSIDDTISLSQHNFSWYKNNEEVSEGKNYTITDTGFYYFIADNIYTDCPDYYSDTVKVTYVYDTIDLNFPDTIPLCVGATHTLSAQSLGATYLWSDGSTDSTYTLSYEGDSIVIIWCRVENFCEGKDVDTAIVRFYPPYAYLGEDTVLCKGDILNFDASILNKSIPAVLEYRWILNGDTIDGTGANNELFTITEKDSGQLILHAIWPGSGCEVGIDTLNFSYYKYDSVDFYLPTDTTICFYEEIAIDLIQNKDPNMDTNNVYLCLSSKGDTISQKSNFILKDTILYYISASNYCFWQTDTLKLRHFTDFNIKMLLPIDTAICQELFPTEIYGLTTEQIDGKCYWLSENKEDTIEIAPSRYINQDGTYPIILSDIYNCSQDYEITVSLKEDCDPIIDFPNVFTPNSDGVNDFFKIISADNVKDFDIVIFNKAGTKVYDYKGLIENFAWNGCYKNSTRDVPEGAYFFVILYKDVNNATRKQAGTLTLLR